MPFMLPDPRRAPAAPAPEPTPAPAERLLTDDEKRLLAEPDFRALFNDWRNER